MSQWNAEHDMIISVVIVVALDFRIFEFDSRLYK